MSGAGIYIKTPSGLVAAATVPGKQGSQGPQSSLTPGTITTGAAGTSAAATITGAGPVQTLNLTIPKGDPGGFVMASSLPEADLDTLTTPGMYYRGSSVAPPANWPATGFAGWIEVLNYPTGAWTLGTVQRATSVRSTAGVGASYQTTYWRSRFSTEGWGPWLQGTFVGRPGGADLTGTGAPEGVVTAPVGAYYTDTAGTNGAWRWLKKWGSSNTGWSVIDGHTGLRALNAVAASGVANVALTYARVARSGNTVEFFAEYTTGTTAPTSPFILWTPPVGFRPLPAAVYGILVPYATASPVNVYTGGNLNVYSQAANSAGTRLRGVWITADAWPTTLPGTAA